MITVTQEKRKKERKNSVLLISKLPTWTFYFVIRNDNLLYNIQYLHNLQLISSTQTRPQKATLLKKTLFETKARRALVISMVKLCKEF